MSDTSICIYIVSLSGPLRTRRKQWLMAFVAMTPRGRSAASAGRNMTRPRALGLSASFFALLSSVGTNRCYHPPFPCTLIATFLFVVARELGAVASSFGSCIRESCTTQEPYHAEFISNCCYWLPGIYCSSENALRIHTSSLGTRYQVYLVCFKGMGSSQCE